MFRIQISTKRCGPIIAIHSLRQGERVPLPTFGSQGAAEKRCGRLQRFVVACVAVAVVLSFGPSAWAQSGTRGPVIQRGVQVQPRGYPVQGVQQGSGSRMTTQQGSATTRGGGARPTETFESKFWKYLQAGPAAYDEWGPFSEKKPGVYPGQSPHGAMLKMYANKAARQSGRGFPAKSILIKHNYSADGNSLLAITVMYKAPGFNPKHGDWFWVKYNPDGSVATTPPEKGGKRIAGRFQSCIDCHAGAGGNDYVFAND